MLGRTPKTVSEMAKRGTIPGFKVGGDWRFFRTEVIDALKPSADPWRKPTRPVRRRAATTLAPAAEVQDLRALTGRAG